MIGHSTILLECGGRKILTDPYFRTWGNPAYARVSPPGKSRSDVADVDLVLISHNHWDHNDGRFLRGLRPEVPVLVPSIVRWLAKLRGAKQVVGMRPWQVQSFGDLSITAVPATHLTVTTGFVIEADGKQVYFAGDTYYRSFFKRIGQEFRIDIALMPVTTFRIPMTMGEKQAVRAAQDLRPSVVIPIHLGVQPRLPLMRTRQTPTSFAQRLARVLPDTKVIVLREGQRWSPERNGELNEN
jgi:L-ascorbate metabolism protein UlaG (beta-lactamase superfamily)